MTYAPINSKTAFLNTSIVFSENESQKIYELTKLTTDLANYINLREIAQYDLVELLTGQQYFDPTNAQRKRQSYRKAFAIGAIAAGGNETKAHGINSFTIMPHFFGGVITDVVDYRPIPFVSTIAVTDQISVQTDSTNYIITVGATSPNVTSGILVLEYLKN